MSNQSPENQIAAEMALLARVLDAMHERIGAEVKALLSRADATDRMIGAEAAVLAGHISELTARLNGIDGRISAEVKMLLSRADAIEGRINAEVNALLSRSDATDRTIAAEAAALALKNDSLPQGLAAAATPLPPNPTSMDGLEISDGEESQGGARVGSFLSDGRAELGQASVGDEITQEYWTSYNVTLHRKFENAEESLAYFHWRNDQYFNYIELMPVEGFDGQVVLDFGCGPGHDLVGFSVYSKPKKLIGSDISPSSLTEAEARLRLHNSPAKLVRLDPMQTRLPFEDDSFDHIHTSGVLHHAPNLDVLLSELRRILKPGGTMNVMVYNYDSLWMHLFVAYHKRIVEQRYVDLTLRQAFTKTTDGEDCPIADCYTPSEFVTLVRRNGFEGKLTGVAISMHELIIAPARFAAIQDRRLPEECRRFLMSLTADEHGFPMHNGSLAGIDACYRLWKAPQSPVRNS